MKKIIAALISLSMAASLFGTLTVYSEDVLPKEGEIIHGFKVNDVTYNETLGSDIVLFEHKKTNGQFLFISNEDKNRAFDIAFRTPASDTGVSHVFEHTSLSGSQNYPQNIFFNVSSQVLNTYMNAMTAQAYTCYPIASVSDEQLLKLCEYYLDGVFKPLIYNSSEAFETEAWRYELESEDSELTINGTVYNEMKGAMSDINTQAYYNTIKTLFPGSNRSTVSGGAPEKITDMTNEDLIEYHKNYYIPSNALVILYGDADYEKYLELTDSYFNEFDNKKADISDSGREQTAARVENVFEFPVGADSHETGAVYTYAVPIDTDRVEDIFAVSVMTSLLNSDASEFIQIMGEEFPSAMLSCAVDIECAQPSVIITVENVNPDDKNRITATLEYALEENAKTGFGAEMTDSVVAAVKRDTLLLSENTDLGVNLIVSINHYWANLGNVYGYFENLEYLGGISSDFDYGALLEKYLVNPSKAAVTLTVPKSGLLEEKETSKKEELAKVKESMSDAQIKVIVKKTKQYKEENNADYSKLLVDINVVSLDTLKEDIKNYSEKKYEISDEAHSGVRYVSAKAPTGDIGMSGIFFDISSMNAKQLSYLSLYANLITKLPTQNYTQQELYSKLVRYLNYSSQYIFEEEGNYFLLMYTTLNEDADEAYKIMNELLYNSDFTQTDIIKSTVENCIYSVAQNINAYPYSDMLTRAKAVYDDIYGYAAYTSGIDFYNFLCDVKKTLQENPQEVIDELCEVRDILHNRNGAISIFAGNEEGCEINSKNAKAFFANLPEKEMENAQYDAPEYNGNEAISINSEVNYNMIYAPYELLETEYNGSLGVISNIVYDKILIPQMRDKNGAYGCMGGFDGDGAYLISYRDPQLAKTYELYAQLGELVKNMSLSEEELERYIISAYSGYATEDGTLSAAIGAVSERLFPSGVSKVDEMNEIVSTTLDDVKASAKLYEMLAQNGIIGTGGKATDIEANRDMFKTVISPFAKQEISVLLDGKTLSFDTPPIMVNDRVLVPIRAISEEMGADVEWNQDTKTATVTSGDTVIKIVVSSDKIDVNGEEKTIDSPAIVINNRTMLPLRAISEALGCEVEWNQEGSEIIIESVA